MTRDEIISRYRHLRAINKQQQTAASQLVPTTTLLECGRRLGVTQGRSFVLDNPDDLNLVFDLAVHTTLAGRARAIDRYARRHPPPPGSDEARVLAAAQAALFSVWQVEERHETVGLCITMPFSQDIFQLIDESLEASCPVGRSFAGRLMVIDGFVMTCGTITPVDELVLLEALERLPNSRPNGGDVAQDPRFAAAVFRAALRSGMSEGVRYIDPAETDLHAVMAAHAR